MERHKDHDATLHLETAIDGKVFHPIATDSFTSILKECHVLIDHWIAETDQCRSELRKDRAWNRIIETGPQNLSSDA